MIRFRLKELMADKSFKSAKRLTFEEVASATGITRTTLSKIANTRGYNTTTDNINQLCRFFGCTVGDVMEFMEDEERPEHSMSPE